jgi:hypothetical protein
VGPSIGENCQIYPLKKPEESFSSAGFMYPILGLTFSIGFWRRSEFANPTHSWGMRVGLLGWKTRGSINSLSALIENDYLIGDFVLYITSSG